MLSKLFDATFLQKNVLGINERNINLIHAHNQRKDYKFADDKLLTKKVLEKHSLACPQTFAVVEKLGEIEQVWNNLQVNESLVIKPAKGSGGDGIIILQHRNGEWYRGENKITEEQIFTHLANILFGMFSFGDTDRAIIEERIIPHDMLTDFYPDGVADVRIILCRNKPLLGMLRLPTKASDGKANLHQGGLGVGIELETGRLTHIYDRDQYLDKHPDTEQQISGKQLPCWKEIMQLSVDVSEAFPLNYLGIDVVIDKDKGPLILEINVRPGLGIQMANRKGLKEVMDGEF